MTIAIVLLIAASVVSATVILAACVVAKRIEERYAQGESMAAGDD